MSSLIKILTAVILYAFSTIGWAQEAKKPADCKNGLIFKTCDDQYALFKAVAEQLKVEQGNKPLIVFGFESCPWCKSLNRIFNSEAGKSFLESRKLKLLEIGTLSNDDSLSPIASGFRVLTRVLMQSIEAPKNVLSGETYPLMAIVDPVKGASVLFKTGNLEQNTKASKGHDVYKIQEAIDLALRKLD